VTLTEPLQAHSRMPVPVAAAPAAREQVAQKPGKPSEAGSKQQQMQSSSAVTCTNVWVGTTYVGVNKSHGLPAETAAVTSTRIPPVAGYMCSHLSRKTFQNRRRLALAVAAAPDSHESPRLQNGA
jgi:hypothetical protein